MPIHMACPSCGKTLAAPDTAAGKRAKCPACGQIMLVPEPTQQAEDFAAPSAAAPPSAPGGVEDSFYDLESGSAGPQAAPPAGAEDRRPCPECGEMIAAGAAKCRFCNALFDPRLRAQAKKYSSSDADLQPVDWVLCILCSLIGCIVGIVYAIQGKPKGMKMVGISIAASIVWSILQSVVQFGPHGFR